MFIDDNECALKTDTCGILGPEYVCKNTLGSFRCEKKSCRGPSCKDKDSSKNTKHVNRTPVKCLRGYEMDKKNKCIGKRLIKTSSMYFGIKRVSNL